MPTTKTKRFHKEQRLTLNYDKLVGKRQFAAQGGNGIGTGAVRFVSACLSLATLFAERRPYALFVLFFTSNRRKRTCFIGLRNASSTRSGCGLPLQKCKYQDCFWGTGRQL